MHKTVPGKNSAQEMLALIGSYLTGHKMKSAYSSSLAPCVFVAQLVVGDQRCWHYILVESGLATRKAGFWYLAVPEQTLTGPRDNLSLYRLEQEPQVIIVLPHI